MDGPCEDGDSHAPRTDGGDPSTPGNETDHDATGSSIWDVDRPEDPAALDKLWIRWTDGGTEPYFDRICDVFPVDFRRSWPYIEFVPEPAEKREKVQFEPVREGSTEADTGDVTPQQFRFVTGVPRQLLRHVPLVILFATLLLFGGAEFVSGVNGLSALIPQLTGTNVLLFGIYVSITPILLLLLTKVGIVEQDELPEKLVVYGLVAALVLGVVVSGFLVVEAGHPSKVGPNVVLTSGYLLTLLVGGMLLYDAVLRIEHLFVSLGDERRQNDIVDDHAAYRKFLTDLNDALNETRFARIPPSRLFGVLFAAQFLIVWIIGSGPQNLDYSIGLVVNFLLNAVLVTIVFKFFVLVRFFNYLMNESEKYGDAGLHYEPFHIDGHGGFRDFGRFAIRINIILGLAGLYLVYRLYVIGGRELPVQGFLDLSDPVVAVIWLLSFVGPVVAYALGVVAWGYFSFWSIHTKMERDKQILARQYQGKRGEQGGDRTPSAGDTIDSFADCHGPEWDAFRSAPTWPLEVNKIVSLLTGNLIPLVLPIGNLFL